jgi:hypothetical protein
MPDTPWVAFCRKVQEGRENPMTRQEFQRFLEEQVQQDIDGALIQEYLATFGTKMMWRIVPATELEEMPGEG